MVTVAAIFFALTVGLVVGSLLLSPKVADQQGRLIKDMRDVVANDFKLNKAQKDIDDKALSAFVPAAIKGKLLGTAVAIVQTGNYPDAVNNAKEALQQADAQVVSITTIDHEMDRPDDVLDPSLTSLNKLDGRFPTDRTALAQLIASIIGHGDASPMSMASTLERENYMHGEAIGQEYKASVRYVVIVAGTQADGSERVANVDQPLITAFQKLGITVLMCEPADAHVSDVEAYRRLAPNVTTVDNIDAPTGHGSLVFAIGGDVGNYGVKPWSTALYPPELSRYSSH